MSAETIEKPDTRKTDNGNELFHYIDKNAMVESVVMGGMVKALCGKVFPVKQVAKPNSPVCSPCKEIYERMGV